MRMLLAALLILAAPAWAEGERAGDFDYYVLSLSWSPTWCALEGDARNADQCDPRHDYGWTLHGLWPQNERGWPSYCRTTVRDASRGQTKAMTDLMGSGGLAWHQWKKHGRCSGMSAADYFETSRRAYAAVSRPEVFRKLPNSVKLPAKVVEEAFLEANPSLTADMVTVTCKQRRIQEVRVCLTKDLKPRDCGRDVLNDCTMPNALLDPVR
ncbi:ribonuclease T2 family protein [Litoreibacter janthinus]|uniref:Ribonuclease T2 n=1 Tax=Litoreibacter janthinus TaxID=670154 RepID=A0A1I6G619_9RHOB|nr:ribonuclease T2 [Litoreibacter janthinus]SFR37632.1 ribonuclease T2 [Litoreibacter janthinus]